MIFRTLFHQLVLALPLYWLAVGVIGVPLGIANTDTHSGDVEKLRVVKKSFTEGNSYLIRLQTYLKGPTPMHRQIMDMIATKAFGKVTNAQKRTIVRNVNHLVEATTKVHIKSLLVSATGIYEGHLAFTDSEKAGSTKPEDHPVSFTNHFYKLDEVDQAGIVIHEATHAILDTFDCFMKSPPHSGVLVDMNKPRSGVICGYEADSLSELVGSYPETTHMNADSYAVAAIYAHKIDMACVLKGKACSPDEVRDILSKPAFKVRVLSRESSSASSASSASSGESYVEDFPGPHTSGHGPQQGSAPPSHNTAAGNHPVVPISGQNPLAQPGTQDHTSTGHLPQSGTSTAATEPAWKNWVNEVRPGNGPPPV